MITRFRKLPVLLAFYLLALLCMPCTDQCDDATRIDQCKISDSHTHTPDEMDTCTPFCSCSCCAISIIANDADHSAGVPPALSALFLENYQANLSMISFSIWQPPRLG